MVSKICDRCFNSIDTKKGDYYKIETYDKGKLAKTGYLHKACNEAIGKEREQTKQMLNMVGPLAARVNSMLDSMGVDKQKMVVDIK